MQYGGRKLKVRGAKILKNKKLTYNIWLLWTMPLIILVLTYVLFQAA
jgi:cytochrome c-type biogenesis protein CcmH/NrfF